MQEPSHRRSSPPTRPPNTGVHRGSRPETASPGPSRCTALDDVERSRPYGTTGQRTGLRRRWLVGDALLRLRAEPAHESISSLLCPSPLGRSAGDRAMSDLRWPRSCALTGLRRSQDSTARPSWPSSLLRRAPQGAPWTTHSDAGAASLGKARATARASRAARSRQPLPLKWTPSRRNHASSTSLAQS